MANYERIHNSELVEQWRKWKESGATPEERTVPVRLAEQILSIASKLLHHPNFARYPNHMKEDMRQEAYIKCQKNLKNIDPEKGSLFAYLTTCCWTAFVVYLGKHYEQMNIRRQLILDEMRKLQNEGEHIGNSQYVQNIIKDLEKTLKLYDKDYQEQDNNDEMED